jgi:hypothetical protein
MRKPLGTLLVAAGGLAFGLGAGSGDDPTGKHLFLIYSTDERSELAPCG